MLLTMNASVPLADKFHKNTGRAQLTGSNLLVSKRVSVHYPVSSYIISKISCHG